MIYVMLLLHNQVQVMNIIMEGQCPLNNQNGTKL